MTPICHWLTLLFPEAGAWLLVGGGMGEWEWGSFSWDVLHHPLESGSASLVSRRVRMCQGGLCPHLGYLGRAASQAAAPGPGVFLSRHLWLSLHLPSRNVLSSFAFPCTEWLNTPVWGNLGCLSHGGTGLCRTCLSVSAAVSVTQVSPLLVTWPVACWLPWHLVSLQEIHYLIPFLSLPVPQHPELRKQANETAVLDTVQGT